MYIHNKAMENLRQCSRCKSNIDISYFGLNRKKEPYKTCDNCRDKGRAYQQSMNLKHVRKHIRQLKLCVIIAVVMLIKAVFQYIKEDFIVKFIIWKLNLILKNG